MKMKKLLELVSLNWNIFTIKMIHFMKRQKNNLKINLKNLMIYTF